MGCPKCKVAYFKERSSDKFDIEQKSLYHTRPQNQNQRVHGRCNVSSSAGMWKLGFNWGALKVFDESNVSNSLHAALNTKLTRSVTKLLYEPHKLPVNIIP